MTVAMSTIGKLKIADKVGFSELVGVSDCVPRKKMPLKPARKLLDVICTRYVPEPGLAKVKVPFLAVVAVATEEPLPLISESCSPGIPSSSGKTCPRTVGCVG